MYDEGGGYPGGGERGVGGGFGKGFAVPNLGRPFPVPSLSDPSSQPSQPSITKATFKWRRAIHPKNSIFVLNELLSASKRRVTYEYLDVPLEERERRAFRRNCRLEDVGVFECEAIIDSETFVGEGSNKADAKLAAAEQAFQAEISRRCDLNATEAGLPLNEDHCPWAAIASLALHRLYAEWQSQGYSVPKELTTLPGAEVITVNNANLTPMGDGGATAAAAAATAALPGSSSSVQDKSPVQLINEMLARLGQGAATFEVVSHSGPPNAPSFLVQVNLQGQTYTAEARSKKLAKTRVAEKALQDTEAWFWPTMRRKQDQEGKGEKGHEGGDDGGPERQYDADDKQ